MVPFLNVFISKCLRQFVQLSCTCMILTVWAFITGIFSLLLVVKLISFSWLLTIQEKGFMVPFFSNNMFWLIFSRKKLNKWALNSIYMYNLHSMRKLHPDILIFHLFTTILLHILSPRWWNNKLFQLQKRELLPLLMLGLPYWLVQIQVAHVTILACQS